MLVLLTAMKFDSTPRRRSENASALDATLVAQG